MPKERTKVERKRKRKIVYSKILRDFIPEDDIRERIIKDLKAGATPTALSVKYGVMVSTIRALAEELVRQGELTYVVKNSRVVYYIAPAKLRSLNA